MTDFLVRSTIPCIGVDYTILHLLSAQRLCNRGSLVFGYCLSTALPQGWRYGWSDRQNNTLDLNDNGVPTTITKERSRKQV